MSLMISAAAVTKKYASGLVALDAVNLDIAKGEIFALLGPNGAGKTTLISVICGIVTMTSGRVLVDGHDIARDFRAARAKIGLVPQEIALDIFATVWDDGALQPRPVRARRRMPPISNDCCATSRCGRSAKARHRALRRHETARDDRQGAEP